MLARSGGLIALAAASTVAAKGKAGTFEIVGHTGVSAQQMFLATENTVQIVDKVQGNELMIGSGNNSHSAWAAEYDLTTNTVRAMDIITNSFCAGGNMLGNGSWLNVGGNNAVSTGGVSLSTLNISEGFGAYKDLSGGKAARIMTPCDNQTCDWYDDVDAMPENRWYPHVETLSVGAAIILGGELWGGFVNSVDQKQSVPTGEYFPRREGYPGSFNISFLQDTQPANLYPLTWLVPNGTETRDDYSHEQLFMQADWQATLFHPKNHKEIRLPNVTHAQRTYPSAGGVALLPMTPENSYVATILMCGGMNPKRDDWDQTKWVIIDTPASDSCVSINPLDDEPEWKDEEDLPEGRTMGNMILLPDETQLVLNGGSYGSEGYGWENWHNGKYGQSYARNPIYRPIVYNASAPAGSKWDTNYGNSSVARLYHSSATLLPDGSVFVAGSSPSADVITEENNATYPFKTEYRAERFYPNYYDESRPVPSGIPKSMSYGGDYFDITLPAGNVSNPDNVRISLMRTGFSTHAYNAGMRQVVLNSTYTQNDDTSVTFHVSQVPPNPAIIAPGPALFFVVVDGVPSVAKFIMLGTGEIEEQPTSPQAELPASIRSSKAASTNAKSAATSSDDDTSAASTVGITSLAGVASVGAALFAF